MDCSIETSACLSYPPDINRSHVWHIDIEEGLIPKPDIRDSCLTARLREITGSRPPMFHQTRLNVMLFSHVTLGTFSQNPT